MSALNTELPARRRTPRVMLLVLNLVALLALVVPAALILSSIGSGAFAPGVLVTIGGLFAAGVLACAGAMALLSSERNHKQSVVLLLPVAMVSLTGALALLVGLSF
jgi:uncharacterized membrane protein